MNIKTKIGKTQMAEAALAQLKATGQPWTREDLEKLAGCSSGIAQKVIYRDQQRSQPVDPAVMQRTPKARFEKAVRAKIRELNADFEVRVLTEVNRRLEEVVLPELRKQKAEADIVLKSRKGVFTKAVFARFLRAMHPDTAAHISEAERNDLMHILNQNKVALLNEKEHPTDTTHGLPRSAAEMMAMRKNKKF